MLKMSISLVKLVGTYTYALVEHQAKVSSSSLPNHYEVVQGDRAMLYSISLLGLLFTGRKGLLILPYHRYTSAMAEDRLMTAGGKWPV